MMIRNIINGASALLLCGAAALSLTLSAPAHAGWAVMPADKEVKVAKDRLSIKAKTIWNRSSLRPSKRGEIWSRDGTSLNELSFYGGIEDGEGIFRFSYIAGSTVPKFKSAMLLTDIVELFEASNRRILQSSVFKVEKTEPAKLGGYDAVRFRYRYAAENDELERTGEAVAAIVKGKLYIINFVAPTIYFFDRDIAEVREIVAGAQITP